MKTTFGSWLLAVLVCAEGCAVAPTTPSTPPPRTVIVNPGLTADEQAAFYHLPEGSEIIPLSWFLALEDDDGRPFVAQLAELGFIADPSPDNGFGLPIGLSVDVPTDLAAHAVPMVGITCSACHVSEVTYQGQVLRIEGGPSNVDIEKFSVGLFQAIERVLYRPWRWVSFFRRVYFYERQFPRSLPGAETHATQQQFRLLTARLAFFRAFGPFGGTAGGHGRTDAFGLARRFIFADKSPPTAPICYPHLWGFERTKWLHWNGNTTSVLERNIGQALGLGALFETKDFSSTVVVRNLHRLERIAGKIPVPRWPPQFPEVDVALASVGESIYRNRCSTCHDRRTDVDGMFDYPLFDVAVIGTDPNHALNFDRAVGAQPFYRALAAVLARIKAKAYEAIPPRERGSWDDDRSPVWRSTRGYVARPLSGIWASPPYLHNGSVPTLNALLLPVDERPARFHVGTREYDPGAVGFVDGGGFVFDTARPGNSNAGHDGPQYGTDLEEPERRALLEYLKTL
jgi:hypothetical protein